MQGNQFYFRILTRIGGNPWKETTETHIIDASSIWHLLLLAKLATKLPLKPDIDSYSIVETESLKVICLNTISIKTFAFKWLTSYH